MIAAPTESHSIKLNGLSSKISRNRSYDVPVFRMILISVNQLAVQTAQTVAPSNAA